MTPSTIDTLIYLTIGNFTSFIMEMTIRFTGRGGLNWKERLAIIALWPLVLVVFIFNFIKEFFK